MNKAKNIDGGMEQSLVGETEYVEIPEELPNKGEAFETSIGVTEKIQLPNVAKLRDAEFERDLKIYQEMNKGVTEKSMKKKKQPQVMMPEAEDSVNEFLVVTKDSVFKPSKWSKPDKSEPTI